MIQEVLMIQQILMDSKKFLSDINLKSKECLIHKMSYVPIWDFNFFNDYINRIFIIDK